MKTTSGMMVGLAVGVLLACCIAPASASILTFQGSAGVHGGDLYEDYGDNVTATSMTGAGGTYQYAYPSPDITC